MPRRAPRRETRGQAVPHAHPGNPCRAIMRVDGTRIRKRIKKDYEKALRDLEHSRGQLDRFQQTDLPQFTRWMNSHFGALLTELRELNHKLAADDAIIFLVENDVLFGGGSYARAYQRVMEVQEHPESPRRPRTGGEDPEGEWDGFEARPESGGFDGEEDPWGEFFNAVFGEFGPGERPRDQRAPRAGQAAAAAVPGHKAARLKELYRAVVRRLHPDRQGEMTAQRTEWWHQAQAAYGAGDAEQLEVILTLCEIGESGTTAHTSASLLQRITAQVKSSLRQIKRELTQRRREPAWNFSVRTDQAEMAEQVGRELKGELMAMRRRWMETQERIANWKAAAERLQPGRRRKVQRQNLEFPF